MATLDLNSPIASRISDLLVAREEKVGIAESSTGGLISATLLAVPGASRYFEGGSVVYTLASRRAFLTIDRDAVKDLRPLTEEMIAVFAKAARESVGATWGIAELGAAGPAGSRYGHDAGISVVGVDGPVSATKTVVTGSDDRAANMVAFTEAALGLLEECLGKA